MAISQANIQSLHQAAAFAEDLRIAYRQLKQLQARMDLYQAGTNIVFNAAVNAAIPAAERAQIATMKPELDTLILSWETGYAGIISPA